MLPTQPNYRAYLLRLWRVNEASAPEKQMWRASLEDAQTGERLAFASLERLFAFLFDQTTQATDRDHPARGKEEVM